MRLIQDKKKIQYEQVATLLTSYHTDTSLYLLSLALALSIHNKLYFIFYLVFIFRYSSLYLSIHRFIINKPHSQNSRLLTSSLSLGVPVPRPTQCV
jgi:hypothetical protein